MPPYKYTDFPVYSNSHGCFLPSLALISAAFLLDSEIYLDGNTLLIGQRDVILRENRYTLDLSEPERLYPVHSMIDVLDGHPDDYDFNGKVIILFIDNPDVRSITSKYKKSHNPAEIVADSLNTLLKDLVGEN